MMDDSRSFFFRKSGCIGLVLLVQFWGPPSNVPIESFDGDFSDEVDEIYTTLAVFVNEQIRGSLFLF